MLKQLPRLEWTPELGARFWRDLEGSDFLADIAFSKFAAPYLLDLVAPHLEGRQKILDYGAGANLYLVREIARRGFDVSYFEPNTTPNDKLEGAGDPDMSARRLPALPYHAFDGVFFSEVIEHLRDNEIAEIFEKIRKALKPDGVLVVTTPQNEDLRLASRYCPQCRQLFHPWGHIRSFTAESLEGALAQHGFRCSELHSVDFAGSREPIEAYKALRHDLFHMLRDIETLVSLPDAVVPEALRERLKGHLSRVAPAASPPSSDDPKRRLIGFGGTLVAVARLSTT